MVLQTLLQLAGVSFLALTASAQNASMSAPGSPAVDNSTTYMNPILDGAGADPWVIQDNGWYYLTFTLTDNITLYRSKTLTDWNHAESKVLFNPPSGQPYSTDLWAPEIHNINGSWYVIFTADPYGDEPPPEQTQFCTFDCPAVNHRMYVLQSSSSDIWSSDYTLKGQLDTFDQFAIDGTYFVHPTGLYHIYSCWYDGLQSWPANLCITQLSDPWTTMSNLTERTIISVPSNPWEKTPYGRTSNVRLSSNEGPEQLISPTGQHYLIYSAARSDNPNYCLGQLALKPDGDPMNAEDWVKNNEGCVFYQNKREQAYSVGHASFVKSPDGTQDWIVYHGMQNPFLGWNARSIRAQQFTWNEDGSTAFRFFTTSSSPPLLKLFTKSPEPLPQPPLQTHWTRPSNHRSTSDHDPSHIRPKYPADRSKPVEDRMPNPRVYTNPAPVTESAKAQLANFHCDLCNKGYARQNEFAAHEGSYEHNHNKRRLELKAMSVSMSNSSSGTKKKKKGLEEEGIMEIDDGNGAGGGGATKSGGVGDVGPKRRFKGIGGGFKRTVEGEGIEKEKDEGSTGGKTEGKVGLSEKEEEVESDAEEPGYEYYDPLKGTACTAECAGLCAAG
ncbi:MAG: hypothetical protein Q9159_007258 [Coniocarpon cinnabarinum]